ncbi:hypothetical protein E4N72_10375 [Treponema vincentii]|uniref:hypothetical protein n=1 Tax=Treponema vincentii TaxID=69710 RepID=UPI0020A54BBC|nr:hypothetical protein [Treponema vincentii]UTC46922.1 hypothetical protein E4N72_10375 [Treponema vincentii]
MIQKAYQRKGVSSNTQAGKDFENKIYTFLANHKLFLDKQKKSMRLILGMIQYL